MRHLRRRGRELEHWPLSSSLRDAWSAGPPAPLPEDLMAGIRPAMLEIDREHAASGWLTVRLSALRQAWVPTAPRVRLGLGLGGLAAASAALLLATSVGDQVGIQAAPELFASPSPGSVRLAESPVLHAAALREPESMIYDLEIEDRSHGALLVFDDDDATIIWIGDAAEPFNGVSLLPADRSRSAAHERSPATPWKLI